MADQLVIDRDASLIGEEASATFSPCRAYRYALTRRWEGSERIAFLMLNPSTADAFVLDPTVRRCISFARSHGFGGLLVLNLFALRSTDPKALYAHPDPVGPDNDAVIGDSLAGVSGPVVAAWGVHGAHLGRGTQVAELLAAYGRRLHCLGATKGGHPRHPLYVPGATPLAEWPGCVR